MAAWEVLGEMWPLHREVETITEVADGVVEEVQGGEHLKMIEIFFFLFKIFLINFFL